MTNPNSFAGCQPLCTSEMSAQGLLWSWPAFFLCKHGVYLELPLAGALSSDRSAELSRQQSWRASQRGLKIHPFLGGFRRFSIAVRNVACNKRSPLLELNKSVICGAGGRPRSARHEYEYCDVNRSDDNLLDVFWSRNDSPVIPRPLHNSATRRLTTLPIELINDQRDIPVAGYKNAQIPSLERKQRKRTHNIAETLQHKT